MNESLISFAGGLLVAAFSMFVIDNYLRLADGLRNLLHSGVVVGLCAWLLQVSGLASPISGIFAQIICTLIVFGMLLWVLTAYGPNSSGAKTLLTAAVLVSVCVVLVQAFGLGL